MKSPERKIVKEQLENGRIVYRYSDFDDEIDDNTTLELGFRFALIVEKFKFYLDGLDAGGGDESVRCGIVLGAIIKDAERELDEISAVISKSLGDVHILYKEDARYKNFYDREVAGLSFLPVGKKATGGEMERGKNKEA